MEALVYTFLLISTLLVLFFSVFFRESPKIIRSQVFVLNYERQSSSSSNGSISVSEPGPNELQIVSNVTPIVRDAIPNASKAVSKFIIFFNLLCQVILTNYINRNSFEVHAAAIAANRRQPRGARGTDVGAAQPHTASGAATVAAVAGSVC